MTQAPRLRPSPLKLVGGCERAANGIDNDPLNVDQANSVVPDADWTILMAHAQNGDGAAYLRLLQEVTPYLRAFAARRHRDARDIEDAVQDVLLTVHAIRHTYGGWSCGRTEKMRFQPASAHPPIVALARFEPPNVEGNRRAALTVTGDQSMYRRVRLTGLGATTYRPTASRAARL